MEAIVALMPLSLFEASEPLAISLWGFALIFLSVKLRSASRAASNQTVSAQGTTKEAHAGLRA